MLTLMHHPIVSRLVLPAFILVLGSATGLSPAAAAQRRLADTRQMLTSSLDDDFEDATLAYVNENASPGLNLDMLLEIDEGGGKDAGAVLEGSTLVGVEASAQDNVQRLERVVAEHDTSKHLLRFAEMLQLSTTAAMVIVPALATAELGGPKGGLTEKQLERAFESLGPGDTAVDSEHAALIGWRKVGELVGSGLGYNPVEVLEAMVGPTVMRVNAATMIQGPPTLAPVQLQNARAALGSLGQGVDAQDQAFAQFESSLKQGQLDSMKSVQRHLNKVATIALEARSPAALAELTRVLGAVVQDEQIQSLAAKPAVDPSPVAADVHATEPAVEPQTKPPAANIEPNFHEEGAPAALANESSTDVTSPQSQAERQIESANTQPTGDAEADPTDTAVDTSNAKPTTIVEEKQAISTSDALEANSSVEQTAELGATLVTDAVIEPIASMTVPADKSPKDVTEVSQDLPAPLLTADHGKKAWDTDALTIAFTNFLPLIDDFVVVAGVAVPSLQARDDQMSSSDLDPVHVVRSLVTHVQGPDALLLNTATTAYTRNVLQALSDRQGLRVGYNPVALAMGLINDYETTNEWQNNITSCVRRVSNLNEEQATAARLAVDIFGSDASRGAVHDFVQSLGDGEGRVAVRELRQSTASMIADRMVEAGGHSDTAQPAASTRFVELIDHEMRRMRAAGEKGTMGGIVSEDVDADAELEDEALSMSEGLADPEWGMMDEPETPQTKTKPLEEDETDSFDADGHFGSPDDFEDPFKDMPDPGPPVFPEGGKDPNGFEFDNDGDMVVTDTKDEDPGELEEQALLGVSADSTAKVQDNDAALTAYAAIRPALGKPRLDRMFPLFEQIVVYMSMVLVPDLVGDTGGLLRALTTGQGEHASQPEAKVGESTMGSWEAADGLGFLLGRDSGFNPVNVVTRVLGRKTVDSLFDRILADVWKGPMSYDLLHLATEAVAAIGKGYDEQSEVISAFRDKMTDEQHQSLDKAIADATQVMIAAMYGKDESTPSDALLGAVRSIRADANISVSDEIVRMDAALMLGYGGLMEDLLGLLENTILVHGVALPVSHVTIHPQKAEADSPGPLERLLGTGQLLGSVSGYNPVEVLVAVLGKSEATGIATKIESMGGEFGVAKYLNEATLASCRAAVRRLRQSAYEELYVLRDLSREVNQQLEAEKGSRPDGPLQELMRNRDEVMSQAIAMMHTEEGLPSTGLINYAQSEFAHAQRPEEEWANLFHDEPLRQSLFDKFTSMVPEQIPEVTPAPHESATLPPEEEQPTQTVPEKSLSNGLEMDEPKTETKTKNVSVQISANKPQTAEEIAANGTINDKIELQTVGWMGGDGDDVETATGQRAEFALG